MQDALHPTYYANAKTTCTGCGRVMEIGSTVESMTVELCSNCHPFYTGKQKLVDTAGRVDRFRARAAKAGADGKPTKTAAAEVSTKKDPTSEASAPSTEERLAEMKKSLEQNS